MNNETIVQTLNDLITILKDADQGLHAAAEEVRDTDALGTEGIPGNVKAVIAKHFGAVKEITQAVTERRDRFDSIQHA